MNHTPVERDLLDEIEPYVLLAASSLITCAYQQNFASLSMLSRPTVFSSAVREGRVDLELPEWLPIEEALLSAAEGGIHSVVKHLALPRAVRAAKPGTRILRIEIGPDLCRDGESVSLVYSPWFRFAAPPYRFEIAQRPGAYVIAAFGHLARVRGLSVRVEHRADASVLWLSERLRIEVIGAEALTEMAILLDGDETSLSLAGTQLSVARRMFPDVYAALRSAGEAGEQFNGASLLFEDDQVVLYGGTEVDHVQT
jgi:hypothetical protein